MISLVRTATEMVHRLPETDTATLTTRDVRAWNVPGGAKQPHGYSEISIRGFPHWLRRGIGRDTTRAVSVIVVGT